MKKLVTMAAVCMIAASVNAQDIKSILKANSYNDAKNMISAAEATLSNEDKAKAYNKLVDLALDMAKKDDEIITKNTLAVQMKQPTEAYDTIGVFNNIKTAFEDAAICDKFDQLPNAKGKIAPKFRDKNANRLISYRNTLINIGNDAFNGKNYAIAGGAFGLYADTKTNPLFSKSKIDYSNVPMIAFYAEYGQYLSKNYKDAVKYYDEAMQDTEHVETAIQLAAAAYQSMNDTENYRGVLLKAHRANPNNNNFFEWIVSSYQDANDTIGLKKFAEEEIAMFPNTKQANYLEGLVADYSLKYEESANAYKKALEIDPDYTTAQLGAARALLLYGNEIFNDKKLGNGAKTKALPYYKESIKLYEIIKNKFPDRKGLWAYPLYSAYYVIGDQAKASEYEKLNQ